MHRLRLEFDIPDGFSGVVRVLNSAPILRAMPKALCISTPLIDPKYSGGGLLDIHVDGNYNDACRMNRRVNLLYYLNPNWEQSWVGEFGIYDDNGETACGF